MSQTLVAVSLGPVQGFVGAARRTRDFWMGSTILSECTKTVAKRVVDTLGLEALVFPAPDNVTLLDPIDFDEDNREVLSVFDVSNIVLFAVDAGCDVPSFVGELRIAAMDYWHNLAKKVGERRSEALVPNWRDQLKDPVIEFYAAWVPLREYAASRQQLMRVLAGRKACRDFPKWDGTPGLPKSSLDGARESILLPDAAASGIRVKEKEELDLVGLVKRADWGNNAIRFPSVSRVAADPWIRGVVELGKDDETARHHLEEIRRLCVELAKAGVLRQRREQNPSGTEDDRKFRLFEEFPFEGSPLYLSRHTELQKELLDQRDRKRSNEGDVKKFLNDISSHLSSLGHDHVDLADPSPYLAVLMADGDAMGQTLSAIAAKAAAPLVSHQRFSRAQSVFAGHARRLINRDLRGACVYAAADDILALIPVDQCLTAARRLRDEFTASVGMVAVGLGVPAPTLSVGIMIGHFMDPLEDLFEYTRAAERRAKEPDRNGLALAIHPRGGAPFAIRDNWQRDDRPDAKPLDERIRAWASAHRAGLISVKTAYDLRQAARLYDAWPVGTPDEQGRLRAALQADARRILRRKKARGAGTPDGARRNAELLAELEVLIGQATTAEGLIGLAHEVIAGQWIGDVEAQAMCSREDVQGGPDV